MFLDFLNQADGDSLDLMKSLRTDEQIDFLFLIGALRDDEVEAGHPLRQFRQDLQQLDAPVAQLNLANLSAADVALITAETLNCEPQTVEPLARILADKTSGNPFFLNEFLNLLYSDNLLYFDVKHRNWQWDISGIQSRMITDNVVDLLTDKLQRLNEESREVISRAAAIGILFDLQTLAVACEKSREHTAAALQAVQAEGLILPIGDACIDQFRDAGIQSLLDAPADLLLNCQFKFSHDRIHQAAYELIRGK